MSDLRQIKKRVFDENRIDELLEKMGCQSIKWEQGGELVTAARPGGRNSRSVQVYISESLTSSIRSKGIYGDIYTIVSYIVLGARTEEEFKETLSKAKKWICDTLGYKNIHKMENKVEINGWLKEIKKKRTFEVKLDINENSEIPDGIRDSYIMNPHIFWIKEGIYCETQEEFEVGYDPDTNRIVVMIRDRYGRLIGVKGRTLEANYEEQNIPKYLYLYKMNKSVELYNLHKALPHIMEKKEIIIFEGFKSVMKCWQMGYRNCVSIEGDTISSAQVTLIKSLGLDTNMILAFDKDKTVEEIREQARKITNRNLYAVYDSHNLLMEKQSPVDQGLKAWDVLYKDKLPIPLVNNIMYNRL